MIVEHHVFRLGPGVGEDALLAADRRVQTEFAPFQPGFIRRTTARGTDGEWLVETLWGTTDEAVAAARSAHPAVDALDGCIDPATVSVRRYETLD